MARLICVTLGLALLAATCARSSTNLIIDVPARISNNLIVMRGSINNSESLTLILDTGASASVIHRARAEQLGLVLGTTQDATTGGGTVEAVEITGATLIIGEAQFENLPLYAIDLTGLQAGLGEPIDGIVGFDVFQRHVVEIDYLMGQVRLHDPTRWAAPADGDAIPIELDNQIPFVTIGLASQGGIVADARVEFDTGQTGSLTLTRPFVEAQRLLDAGQRTLSITTGAILAGQVPVQVARLGSLRIGRTTIASPTANITPDDTGAATATGILGGEILRRFHVTVDYSHGQVILRSNEDLDDPIEFDMTGMSLAAQENPAGFLIRTIIEGSPAAEAGVAAGDMITAIDGRGASETTLAQLRQRFRVPDLEMALTLVRDGAKRQVTIRTRRLI